MVNNHQDPPPRVRGSNIPVLTTAARRAGLRSGGPPPEPTTGVPTQRMTIRLPARTGNQEMAPTIPHTAERETQETAPPQYTERDDSDPAGTPVVHREPTQPEANQSPEETQVVPRIEPVADARRPIRRGAVQGTITTTPRIAGENVREDSRVITREEPQRAHLTLDPEITGVIRQMAQEQRNLRTQIEGSRQDTFEL